MVVYQSSYFIEIAHLINSPLDVKWIKFSPSLVIILITHAHTHTLLRDTHQFMFYFHGQLSFPSLVTFKNSFSVWTRNDLPKQWEDSLHCIFLKNKIHLLFCINVSVPLSSFSRIIHSALLPIFCHYPFHATSHAYTLLCMENAILALH